MDTGFILAAADAIRDAIVRNEREIEALDREIGDGDHYINMRRGIDEIVAMKGELGTLAPDAIFQRIGMKLMSTIGGASGPLIAGLFISMGQSAAKTGFSTRAHLAQAFAAGVESIRSRGKAEVGHKTMLDVLIPVSTVLSRCADSGVDSNTLLKEIRSTAQQGMLSTRDLIATKGRAAFLGERALGHIDPGSRTSQLIIDTICDCAATQACATA